MNIDRRKFFWGGIAGIFTAATGRARAHEEPDSPYDLLRDHRLCLMAGRNLFPAEVFVDGRKISRAVTVIARPRPNHPAYGAVEFGLLRNGGPYLQGDRLATDWVYGIVTWRRAQDQEP